MNEIKIHGKNETKNETKNEIVARNQWNSINFIIAGRNEEKIEMKWSKNYFILHGNEWKKKMKQLPRMNETKWIILNEIVAIMNEKKFHSFTVVGQVFLCQLP